MQRKDKKKARLDRILEITPGLLTWGALTSPIWLGPFVPKAVAFFLTFLAVFWVYRAIMHLTGVIIGYRRYKREIKLGWLKKCRGLDFSNLPDKETLPKSFDDLKHLIIIPAVNESYEVLESSLKSIAESHYPKENIFVTYTIEEKESKRVVADIEKLKAKYGKALGTVWTFVHPRGLKDEVVGAAANRTWGAKRAVERIRDQRLEISAAKGKPLGFSPSTPGVKELAAEDETANFLVTTYDADMRIHPQFLARLAYEYLTTDKRYNRFYQTAVYLFDNNLWDVPPLMRIQANSITLAVLSSWTFEADRKDTWSCYSVALPTLIEAGFWNVELGVDDTPFYWSVFLAKNGDFSGRQFYIPVYADAVQDKNWLKTHISQYKQLLRWGWGVIVFPLAMRGFLTKKEIPLTKKISHTFQMIEQYVVWRTVTFLITFGFGILIIANPSFSLTSIGYKLPDIAGWVLTSAFILLLPLTILRTKLVKPVPKEWPIWKKAWTFLEGPLVIVNLLTYTFVPYLDAETRLMLGKKLEFRFTPKVRNKDD